MAFERFNKGIYSNFSYINRNIINYELQQKYYEKRMQEYSVVSKRNNKVDILEWAIRIRKSLKEIFTSALFYCESEKSKEYGCFASTYYLRYYSLFHAMLSNLFLDEKQSINELMETTHTKVVNCFQSNYCTNKFPIINNKIKEDLVFFGVNENKIEVIPEYIKPFETKEDFESIPQNVWEFINNSNFLIAANGWIRFYNDEDLYGMDMLIDLVYELSKRNIQVSLMFALLGAEIQSMEEKKYYCKLKNKIKELGIENNIFIFESKNKEFYPILQKSQLFIRPTNTDGNSVSVMEAMDLEIPCITSNACPRPEGVVIFKTRDMDDLIKKTMELIQNYEAYKEKAKYIKVEHNDEKLLTAYKKVVKN